MLTLPYLEKLKPTEVLFILKGFKTQQEEIFRLTLFDLLLKNFLSFEIIERQPTKNSKISSYVYINAGQNIKSYFPDIIETCLLKSFLENESRSILFRVYFSNVLQEFALQYNLYPKFIDQSLIKQNFTKYRKLFFLKEYKLNDDGEILKSAIEREIQILYFFVKERNFEDPIFLNKINGNIFFIDTIEPQFTVRKLQEMGNELANISLCKQNDNYSFGVSIIELFRNIAQD